MTADTFTPTPTLHHFSAGAVSISAQPTGVRIIADLPLGDHYISVGRTTGRGPSLEDDYLNDLRDEFDDLADEWQRETGHVSSPVDIAMHPAYQRIIGFGPAVIPLILEDLRARGGQWYWALRALTGESPVPMDAHGSIRVAKQAWLDWGQQRGYLN